MDDQTPANNNNSPVAGSTANRTAAEPMRSRWTPKPEQILILESIFNSGMVNPPKDETVRIRKLLEKFGAVGDANVFYWFQNRRSRSRRRQRQLQAALAADPRAAGGGHHAGGAIMCAPTSSSSSTSSSNSSSGGFFPCSSSSSSSFMQEDGADDLFSISRQMGFADNYTQTPFMYSSDASQLHYQPGTITVFINGVLSEVPRGTIDLRAMFGQDVMLVHSSGEVLPVNEYGILTQSLQMGESYFLVSRPT
ncbi:WUSCHEL-related homeobox 11 [Elaeis guineensis]|uniref:WUSCHEL-related homeobox 11 n=1 Tax=Elaeis guineensis var. tenera TaxID=51953 RepID=A0A6I9SEJ0_ELAGV|nr:WUSCHEL-related homeobox 11 [Elaeis guineensis]